MEMCRWSLPITNLRGLSEENRMSSITSKAKKMLKKGIRHENIYYKGKLGEENMIAQ